MRIRNAFVWTLVSLFMISLIIGIAYGLAGFVDYPTLELVSGLAPVSALSGGGEVVAGGDAGDGDAGEAAVGSVSGSVSTGVSDVPAGAPRSSCILPGAAVPGVVGNPATKLKDGLVSCWLFFGR